MRWKVAKPTLQPSSSLSCAFLYLHELPPSMSTNHCVNLGRLLTCSVFQLFLKNSQILRNSPIGEQDIAYVCLCLCACICFLKENRRAEWSANGQDGFLLLSLSLPPLCYALVAQGLKNTPSVLLSQPPHEFHHLRDAITRVLSVSVNMSIPLIPVQMHPWDALYTLLSKFLLNTNFS